MPDTNINEEHRRAFEALTSGRFDNFCLVSCSVDGEATAAISPRHGHERSGWALEIAFPELRWNPGRKPVQSFDRVSTRAYASVDLGLRMSQAHRHLPKVGLGARLVMARPSPCVLPRLH